MIESWRLVNDRYRADICRLLASRLYLKTLDRCLHAFRDILAALLRFTRHIIACMLEEGMPRRKSNIRERALNLRSANKRRALSSALIHASRHQSSAPPYSRFIFLHASSFIEAACFCLFMIN